MSHPRLPPGTATSSQVESPLRVETVTTVPAEIEPIIGELESGPLRKLALNATVAVGPFCCAKPGWAITSSAPHKPIKMNRRPDFRTLSRPNIRLNPPSNVLHGIARRKQVYR